jgi:hypothetical protein
MYVLQQTVPITSISPTAKVDNISCIQFKTEYPIEVHIGKILYLISAKSMAIQIA